MVETKPVCGGCPSYGTHNHTMVTGVRLSFCLPPCDAGFHFITIMSCTADQDFADMPVV